MNRRTFLQTLFASTATIVIAPANAIDDLSTHARRTYVDMGRRSGLRWLSPLDALLGAPPDGSIYFAINEWYRDRNSSVIVHTPGIAAGTYLRQHGRWHTLEDLMPAALALDLSRPSLLTKETS